MSMIQRIEELVNKTKTRLGSKFNPKDYLLEMDAKSLFQLRCSSDEALNNKIFGIDIDVATTQDMIMLTRKPLSLKKRGLKQAV